ncbi:MAG: hypothetical protein H0U21_06430 [Acidimicrobiia bacterium]|nr:hypothetical protein [Acidimicrobiia bacterium]
MRRLSRRGLINPVTRAALVTWVWNHRHEGFRWGRSLWDQLVGRGDVAPAHALRTGRLLASIAADDTLRNAPELRKVTMVDDIVDLDVEPGWSGLPKLVEKVRRVKGVTEINVNGAPVTMA